MMAEPGRHDGVAVITGAGSGLGAAMADRFAAEGLAIAAIDINGAQAAETAARLAAGGARAIALACDVADRASVRAAADAVADAFGAATVVCANVGVQQFGAIDRLSDDDWRWVLDVNVMGVVHTVDAFLPLLRRDESRGRGRRHIVVTSSSAAYSPGIRMGAYTTSKYAVTGYAETLRMELAGEGIGVSILFPAGMRTDHLQSSRRARPADRGESVLRREDIDAMMASRRIDADDHVATAAHATRHLIADLAANRRYIVTHGDCRAAIVENHDDLLAAHDRAQGD